MDQHVRLVVMDLISLLLVIANLALKIVLFAKLPIVVANVLSDTMSKRVCVTNVLINAYNVVTSVNAVNVP